jgi:hypothetical protein
MASVLRLPAARVARWRSRARKGIERLPIKTCAHKIEFSFLNGNLLVQPGWRLISLPPGRDRGADMTDTLTIDLANAESGDRAEEFIERCRSKHRNMAPMPGTTVGSKRDHRIDALRDLALLMIFVDHIPGDVLGLATLHNLGFSDAAEVFVLLAGMSAMLAYRKGFERGGVLGGLRPIIRRWTRLYLFQIGLLLTTLVVVLLWTMH